MAYRNIKPKKISLVELARSCGLFTPITDEPLGYGCRSKSKYKDQPGLCRPWDCPLAEEIDDDGDVLLQIKEVI